ncbi:hypothetical protein IQ247_29605 [Plectonema cf. radiosum LEGE 06105]|uniref:Uncharacterized protein n=1 Tax=Plectonema cf. radiosum LEGE 06105 TaxID=945769 RepID=A0A8J7FPC1_9CYAN|nr:hypothetical protein [Plectonema radiosum]MBE9216761.1 hypothetical protein [Plectonema cf. radiosum LEGE 06105]
MPLALSSAYRGYFVGNCVSEAQRSYRVWFFGMCDMPLALSSAYRVWFLGVRSRDDVDYIFCDRI